MNIHEHQAKEILKKYGIIVPNGVAIFSVEEIDESFKKLNTSRIALKAQIHAGGRGKAGGIKIVNNIQELKEQAKDLFGQTYMTGKRLMHNVDYGVDVTRRDLQTAAPVISDLGGASGLARARGALQDYDVVKAKVLGADRTGQHLLGGLRARVPELGLG